MPRDKQQNHGWTPKRIKQLRQARGADNSQFAKLFRVHWRTVDRWESGENIPVGPATVLFDLMEQKLREREVVEI